MSHHTKDLLIFTAIVSPFWAFGFRFFWKDAKEAADRLSWDRRNKRQKKRIQRKIQKLIRQEAKSRSAA